MIFQSACLSNNKITSKNKGTDEDTKDTSEYSNSGFGFSSPNTSGGEGTPLVTITRAVPSNDTSKKYSLDLLGDGTDSMGTHCVQSKSKDIVCAPNTCCCVFEYKRDGVANKISVGAYYSESNLLRCDYQEVIDEGITEVNVHILIATVGLKSNTRTLQFTTSGSGTIISSDKDPINPNQDALDPKNPYSYSEVIRYQCRDYVWVPYVFQGGSSDGIYDPLLSENPIMSYPMTFYTSNLGGTIGYFSNASAADPENLAQWRCSDKYLPENPHDTNFLIYSKNQLNGSYQISPKDHKAPGVLDSRFQFYLAKEPIGDMNLAVTALASPGVWAGASAHPPVGYALRAQHRSDLGYSVCPDSSAWNGVKPDKPETITETDPTGSTSPRTVSWEWVKVWNFRSSHHIRQYPKSSDLVEYSKYGVSCYDIWSDYFNTVTGECGTQMIDYGDSSTLVCKNSYMTGSWADRILGPDDGKQFVCRLQATTNPFDTFMRIRGGTGTTTSKSQIAPLISSDPNFTNGTPGSEANLYTEVNQSGDVDEVSREEFLFVVSPTSITKAQMADPDDETAKIYRPFRFKHVENCDLAMNLDADANCTSNQSQRIADYELYPLPTYVDDNEDLYMFCALQRRVN